MKKIFIFLWLIFFVLFVVSVNAQEAQHGLGLTYGNDNKFSSIHYLLPPRKTGGAFLEPLIDFQDSFPPPKDQGGVSSCSSWATVYAMRSYLEQREHGYVYTKANGDLDSSNIFSPLYIYNQVRDMSKRCDSSSSGIDTNLEQMKMSGVCKLPSFNPSPFSPYKFPCCQVKPLLSPNAAKEAQGYKIRDYGWALKYDRSYESGRRLNIIWQFLSAGYPVVLGIDVDSSFYHEGGQWEDSCWVWRKADNVLSGAHAVVCIGYNKKLKAIKILNSWGPGWANKGYGYIGEELIDDKVAEAYIVNPGNEVPQIDGSSALTYGEIWRDSITNTQNFLQKLEDRNFFVRFRYQPYNNIRIMPVEIDEKKNTAVFKVYEIHNNQPVEIDVFFLKVGENYTFINRGLRYDFRFTEIKRWNGPLSKHAAWYIIKAVNITD